MTSSYNKQDRNPNIRKATPGGSPSTSGIVVSDISPRITEWIPQLLDELLPHSLHTIRKFIADIDPQILTHGRYGPMLPVLQNKTFGQRKLQDSTQGWSDSEAEAVDYQNSLVEFACKYAESTKDNLSTDHQGRYETLKQLLTEVGTGRGSMNGGLEALAKGPVALHRELDETPQPITLLLDGQSWTDLADRSTGVRALAAIAVLGSAFDVRLVISPSLEKHLRQRYPKWYDAHLSLTESPDNSPHETAIEADQSPGVTHQQAWEVLQELSEESGRLRLLGNLPAGGSRDYRDLKQDDEINVKPDTVGRYVLDLEELDLVSIDRSGRYNSTSLTPLGQLAVEEFLADDYRLIHPSQTTFETALTPTPQSDAGTVYRAQWDTEGGRDTFDRRRHRYHDSHKLRRKVAVYNGISNPGR
jgi:hypothetical protein